MELTVLGNNGPYPSAGGACSGYLIKAEGVKLLIDCGNGVLSNLLRFVKIEELDAIILTHLHSDHMSDMMILRYAIDIKIKKGVMSKPIKVYAPQQPAEEYNRLNLEGVFKLNAITSNLALDFRNLHISFCEMKHPVMCFAVCVDEDGKRLVFSGDTAWNSNIIEFSKDCSLLMLDAGLLSKDKTSNDVPHMTAKECGTVAKTSSAGRLLLTHFWPEYNLNDILREAKESYPDAELAELLKTYVI